MVVVRGVGVQEGRLSREKTLWAFSCYLIQLLFHSVCVFPSLHFFLTHVTEARDLLQKQRLELPGDRFLSEH